MAKKKGQKDKQREHEFPSFLLVHQNHSITTLDVSSDWLLKFLLKLLMTARLTVADFSYPV
jgi:hypothetical protein